MAYASRRSRQVAGDCGGPNHATAGCVDEAARVLAGRAVKRFCPDEVEVEAKGGADGVCESEGAKPFDYGPSFVHLLEVSKLNSLRD